MDWQHFLFNPDHTVGIQDFILLGVILVGFNLWRSWYENRRRRQEAMRTRDADPEHPVWHAPKKKKRSKK